MKILLTLHVIILHWGVFSIIKCSPLLPLERGLRILGGSLAAPHSVSYIVSLQTSFGQHFCGGALIHESWVLTAAHCNIGLGHMQVVAGETVLSEFEGTEQRVSAVRLEPHPLYNNETNDNDIMLIKLSSPLVHSVAVSLVSLPKPDSVLVEGRRCEVSGWGSTSLGSKQRNSPALRTVWVSVVSSERCNSSHSFNGTITQNMICAGSTGKDSCQGDSGGPLVCRSQVFGLVSWGRSCGKDSFPGVYTSVSRYRNWIEHTISSSHLPCSGSSHK